MIVSGVALLAVSARWTFALPATDVPQSAQTLAVLMVGGLAALSAGARAALAGAAATVAVYLGIGALGAPVFADGAAGFESLAGTTGGFLMGFLPAAVAAAWLWQRTAADPRRWIWRVLGLIGCHGLILVCGWARLSLLIGAVPAWQAGVAPFVIGAVVKSLAAAALLALAETGLGNRVASARKSSR